MRPPTFRRLRLLAARSRDALVVSAWMVIVELAVRFLPVGTVAALIGAPLATGEAEPTGDPVSLTPIALRPAEFRRLRSLDVLARRWPFGSGPCLRQALVAGHVLRHHGPHLRIGATLEGTDLVGHAWLELGALELGRSAGFAALVTSPTS